MNNFSVFGIASQGFCVLLWCLLGLSAATAQSTAQPDTVCAGSNVYYKIRGASPQSSYSWGLRGEGGSIAWGQGTDSIRVQWTTTAGRDTLWVVETNAAACTGDTAKIAVQRVPAPTANFDNATVCTGELLRIQFTGFPPYALQLTHNGTAQEHAGLLQNPWTVPNAPGSYQLLQVSDRHCSNRSLPGQTSAIIGSVLYPLQIVRE